MDMVCMWQNKQNRITKSESNMKKDFNLFMSQLYETNATFEYRSRIEDISTMEAMERTSFTCEDEQIRDLPF